MKLPELYIQKVSPLFKYKDKVHVWDIRAKLGDSEHILYLQERFGTRRIETIEHKDITTLVVVNKAVFSKKNKGKSSIKGYFRDYETVDDLFIDVSEWYVPFFEHKTLMDARLFETEYGYFALLDHVVEDNKLEDDEEYYMTIVDGVINSFDLPDEAVESLTIGNSEPLPKSMHGIYDEILATKEEAIYAYYENERTKEKGSKLMGDPYFPKNMDYPTYDEGTKPMRLIAQINLKDLPQPFRGLPQKGILQFYLPIEDGWMMEEVGAVIYHENDDLEAEDLITDFSFVAEAEKKHGDTWYYNEAYALSWKMKDEYIGFYDGMIEKGLSDEAHEIVDEHYDFVRKHFGCHYTKIGGYSENAQGNDDRVINDHLKKYNVLLLQIVSSGGFYLGANDQDVQFFINEEKLKQLDFSDIMITCCH